MNEQAEKPDIEAIEARVDSLSQQWFEPDIRTITQVVFRDSRVMIARVRELEAALDSETGWAANYQRQVEALQARVRGIGSTPAP